MIAGGVLLGTIGPVVDTALFVVKSMRDPAQMSERQRRWSAIARPGEELAGRYRAFDAARPR